MPNNLTNIFLFVFFIFKFICYGKLGSWKHNRGNFRMVFLFPIVYFSTFIRKRENLVKTNTA